MSYILEALRRADAERQRGDVPGLHAQPQAVTTGEPAPARWPLGLVVGAALGLLVLGGAGVGWWMGAAKPAFPALVAKAPQPATPAMPEPAPQVAKPQAQPLPQPQPGGPVNQVPVAAPAVPPALVAPVAPVAPVATAQAARPLPSPPVPAVAPAAAVAVPSAPAPALVAARPLKLSELPEDLRRELPAIAPGGSVYAEHAPSRMVVLNGQVFHEGDRPAPGLQVHQILPRSVVFDFKGQRFELPL